MASASSRHFCRMVGRGDDFKLGNRRVSDFPEKLLFDVHLKAVGRNPASLTAALKPFFWAPIVAVLPCYSS